jgi:hypothetical protein
MIKKNRVITINKFLKNTVLDKVGLTRKTRHLNMRYVHNMFIVCFRLWDRDNSMERN